MYFAQKVFAIVASSLLLFLIIELVRRGKLREEYSFLWILTGATILVLTIWYDLLLALSRLIGAVLPTTTLFLFGMMFLVLITIHFSVKISCLSTRIETMAQDLALMEKEVSRCREERVTPTTRGASKP